MKVTSKRFGEIEIDEAKVIRMQEAILGFPNSRRFAVLDPPANDSETPFRWLLSIDEPEICFLVTDPGIFFKDYEFDLPEGHAAKIGVKSVEDVIVLTLLTVPDDPRQITANLRGPLVVNPNSMEGLQIVLDSPLFTTKHYIFLQASAGDASGESSSGGGREVAEDASDSSSHASDNEAAREVQC